MPNQRDTLSLCQCVLDLRSFMKKRSLSFQDAYNFLLDKKKIVLIGQSYIYDLSAQALIDNKK
jgi:hypothetical protein